jgi:hypothetical protein
VKIVYRLLHDRFLPYPFPFIIYQSIIRHCTV